MEDLKTSLEPPRAEGRAPASDIVLEARHLSRVHEGRTLVGDVSVAVRRGEVLALIGASGAGKSSFLRLLNRLDEPTGGEVLFEGKDYRGIEPSVLRRRIGMMMQSAFLFPGTIADNIAFGPRQNKTDLSADAIAKLLVDVGLPGYALRDVANLSGGEAQRVSLARALANNPDILLLDEPTSALDADSARAIEKQLVETIRRRRMTCVIVTHNRDQWARFADRAMRLDHGRAVAIGPTREILDVS